MNSTFIESSTDKSGIIISMETFTRRRELPWRPLRGRNVIPWWALSNYMDITNRDLKFEYLEHNQYNTSDQAIVSTLLGHDGVLIMTAFVWMAKSYWMPGFPGTVWEHPKMYTSTQMQSSRYHNHLLAMHKIRLCKKKESHVGGVKIAQESIAFPLSFPRTFHTW